MIKITAEDDHVQIQASVSGAKAILESVYIIDGLVDLVQNRFEVSQKEADEMLMAAYDFLKDGIRKECQRATVSSDFVDLIDKFRKDKKDE